MNENKPKYKRPRTEAQRAGEKRYKAKTEVNFSLHLNRNTDADILDRLDRAVRDGESIQGFIKSCIRYEMGHEEIYIERDPDTE